MGDVTRQIEKVQPRSIYENDLTLAVGSWTDRWPLHIELSEVGDLSTISIIEFV